MQNFTSSEIKQNSEIISEQLKGAREKNKIKITEVSRELGISEKYLQALEEGRFGELPLGVYGKNFLREYSDYLRLNTKELLEIFDTEISGGKEEETRKNLFSRKIPKSHYFLTIPKIIKNIFIVLVVIICLAYLGVYIKRIIEPPVLTIDLINDLAIEENYIFINGQTETEAEVLINDELVLIDKEGNFNKKINLKNGLNNITIVSQKKYSRKNIIERKILVK